MLGILLFAGFGFLYYTFLLNPMLKQMSLSQHNIKQYNTELENIKDTLYTNKSFKKDYDRLMDEYTLYSARMPYTYRDPEIAFNIMGLAKKTSSTVKSINFLYNSSQQVNNLNQGIETGQTTDTSQATAMDKIAPIPVNIELVSTDYLSAMNLVKILETDTRLVQIKSLRLTSAAEQDSNVSGIQVKIGLEYYYFRDNNLFTVEYNFNNGAYGKPNLFQ